MNVGKILTNARFVTGFCDINQPTVMKRSMFDVAAELGILEQWVELRHQFTHGGELPGLAPLERAVEGALVWLWDAFWSKLEDEHSDERGVKRKRNEEENRENKERTMELRRVLKTYVKMRRTEVKISGEAVAKGGSKTADETCEVLFRAVAEDSSNTDVLLSLLVDEQMIVPSNHTVGSAMTGAFVLWDPLLTKLALSLRRFLVEFVLRMLCTLTTPSDTMESQDHKAHALYRWIEHIFISKAWASRRRMSKDGLRQLRTEVVRESTLSSGYWAMELATTLTKSADLTFKMEWQEVTEAIAMEERSGLDQGDTDVTDNEDCVHTDIHDDDNVARESGTARHAFSTNNYGAWRPPPGIWRPVPIGVFEGETNCLA